MKAALQFVTFLGVLFLWIQIFGSANILGFIISALVGFGFGGWIGDLVGEKINKLLKDKNWDK